MEQYTIGQKVIDIRNGQLNTIVDFEYINNINLIYTENTSIPSEFLIDTEKAVWYHLLNRRKNGMVVTPWLVANGTLNIRPNLDFDFEEFKKKCFK